MSVIAVQKKDTHVEIASDSQITHDMSRIQNITGFKLLQVGNVAIGFVGDATVPTFLRLYLTTTPLPEMTLEGISTFVVAFYEYVDKVTIPEYSMSPSAFIFASHDKVFVAEDYYIFEVQSHYSVGAGVELCDALMRHGNSPLEAVIETCKSSIFCSPPIEEYKLYADRIDYYVSE